MRFDELKTRRQKAEYDRCVDEVIMALFLDELRLNPFAQEAIDQVIQPGREFDNFGALRFFTMQDKVARAAIEAEALNEAKRKTYKGDY